MRRRKQSALHARWTENRLQPSPFECAMIYTCDSNNVDRVSKHIEATFSTIHLPYCVDGEAATATLFANEVDCTPRDTRLASCYVSQY